MSYSLIALSGFLGLPSDFAALKLPLWAPNLWRSEPGPLSNWAKRFNRGLNRPSIVIGYSMGGRLAMHALLANPEQYRAAIIIAAHPGLTTNFDRTVRLEHDKAWAERFKTMPWAELLRLWDQNPVLRSSTKLKRYEKNYSRVVLAKALRYFSLGNQAYLIPAINQLRLPILWISPQSESGPLTQLKLAHPHSTLMLVPNSNHRLMFEQSCLVAKAIRHFLSLLE